MAWPACIAHHDKTATLAPARRKTRADTVLELVEALPRAFDVLDVELQPSN